MDGCAPQFNGHSTRCCCWHSESRSRCACCRCCCCCGRSRFLFLKLKLHNISPSLFDQITVLAENRISQKREKKAVLYLASTTLSMLILASFRISFMPPALPDMLIAGAAAPAAAGAAAGAAAAGALGFSFSCIVLTPSHRFGSAHSSTPSSCKASTTCMNWPSVRASSDLTVSMLMSPPVFSI